MAVKIRKNDEVLVIAGKHRGETGKVISVDHKKNRIVVDKLNIVKRHTKPKQTNPDGGILEKESPMHLSNVALKEKGKTGKHTRVGFKVSDSGKKTRIAKRTGKEI